MCWENDELLSVKSGGIYVCLYLYVMCLPQEKAVGLHSEVSGP